MRRASIINVLSHLNRTPFVLLLVLAFAALPSTASAFTVDNATVTGISTNLNFPGLVFIAVDPAPTPKPSCSTNNQFDYAFNSSTSEANKNLYALLLTAYSAKNPVQLFDYDRCNLRSDLQDLKAVTAK